MLVIALFCWRKMEEQTKSEKEIIQEIDEFYDVAKEHRELYEKEWYFNLAFYLGYQWIVWNDFARRIEEPKAPSWRVRLTANLIAPNCDRIIGKLTKNRPIPIIIPATSEDEDVNAARMGEKVLQYLSRVLKVQTKNQEMWLWAIIVCSSFKLPYWDKDAKMAVDNEGKTHLGEVGIDILSAFEVYPEVGATNEQLRKVMICRTYPLDYIKEKWEDKEVPDEGISGQTPIEERLLDLMKKQTPSYIPPPGKKEKSGNAIVKEYRELPSSKYKNGRRIVIANGVLLENGDLPHKFLVRERKLGLIKYDYIKVPGRFWGKGRPQDLIPLQKEYNKTRSQIIEIKNLMAKPKWFVPIGSGIKKTHLTSEPGEIVFYNSGVPKPEQSQMASLPAYVLREPEMTRRDIQDVSGLHEVSKAQVPSGVRSGLAIQYLQEQDDTQLGPIITRYEEAESELWNFTLSIVKENYKELRLIRIIGQNGKVEVFDFKGANISDGMDVIIQAGSAFPANKVAKQQFIMGLWQNKIIADPRQIMKLLEFGSYEEIYEDFATDEKNAQEENQILAQGKDVAAKYYDDDDIHIYEHMRDVKSNKYPQIIEELFAAHIGEHAERKAQKLSAMPTPEQMAGKPSLSPRQQTGLTPKKPAPAMGA